MGLSKNCIIHKAKTKGTICDWGIWIEILTFGFLLKVISGIIQEL